MPIKYTMLLLEMCETYCLRYMAFNFYMDIELTMANVSINHILYNVLVVS